MTNYSPKLSCKICNGKRFNQEHTFKIINKFKTQLLICKNCGFQKFSNPNNWIDLAYSDAIASTDTGIVKRCLLNAKLITSYLTFNCKMHNSLDWGTGSGLYVRLMRDKGWNTFGYEPIANPILAKGFSSNSLEYFSKNFNFQLITAFEVMEHIEDPLAFLKQVLNLTDTLIFSTLLVDKNFDKDWWYYSTDTGQHISFYTKESLKYMSEHLNCFYLSIRTNDYHIFTKSRRNYLIFKLIFGHKRNKIFYPLSQLLNKFIFKRKGLIVKDFFKMKNKIR